jgi:hypothetical protein
MFKENRLIFNSSNRPKSSDENDFYTDILESDTPLSADETAGIDRLIKSSKISLDIKKEINQAFQENIIDTETHENLLIEAENERDPAALEKVRRNISERRENVQALIREFDLHSSIKINQKKISLFREDNDIEQQKAEFIRLSPKEQKEVLQEVKNYLEVATRQFQELSNLVSNENIVSEANNFKQLSTRERSAYIDESKKIQENYLKLLQAAHIEPAKIQEKMELLHIHGLEGKKLLLQNLQERLKHSALDLEFEEANQSRRDNYPDFKILTPNEKKEVLIKIREEIKAEYIYKFRNHRYFFAATSLDRERFEATFQGKFQIKIGEISIQYLDSIMESLFKIKIEEQKFPKEILDHFDWDQLPDYERSELINSGVVLKYAENVEHMELDAEYKLRLQKYLKMEPLGIINKKGVESYYKWFQRISLERKSDIINFGSKIPSLDYLELTKGKRIEHNKLFLSLPKKIQSDNRAAYLEKGYEERAIFLQELIELSEKDDELTIAFEEKLDEKIEAKLLTPRSRKRYVKMFAKMSVEEKELYLEDCNLDAPHRQEVLDEFRALLQLIPQNKAKKIEEDFYNLDLRKRETKLARLKALYVDSKDEVTKVKLEAEKATIQVEQTETKPELSPVDIFLASAEKYELQNDKSTAIKFYKEALTIESTITPQQRQEIEDKIAALEEDESYYQKLQEGHINEIIHTEVENLINENPTLLVSKEIIAMLEAAYELEKKNEELQAMENAQTQINKKLSDLSQFAANTNQEELDQTAESQTSEITQEIQESELSEQETAQSEPDTETSVGELETAQLEPETETSEAETVSEEALQQVQVTDQVTEYQVANLYQEVEVNEISEVETALSEPETETPETDEQTIQNEHPETVSTEDYLQQVQVTEETAEFEVANLDQEIEENQISELEIAQSEPEIETSEENQETAQSEPEAETSEENQETTQFEQEIELDINQYKQNPNQLISFFSQVQNEHPEARISNRFKISSDGNKLSSETFKKEVLDPKKLDFIQNKVAPLLYQRLKIENNPAMQATILKYISNYKFVNSIDELPIQEEAA